MMGKIALIVFLILSPFFSSPSLAASLDLSVRYSTGSGGYEAVLRTHSTICMQISAASSVQVTGFEVLIEAPFLEQVPCIIVPPDTYYEFIAYIGELAPGVYTVTWNQEGNFSKTVNFSTYNSIPSSSSWALLLITLGIFVFVYPVLRKQTSSP